MTAVHQFYLPACLYNSIEISIECSTSARRSRWFFLSNVDQSLPQAALQSNIVSTLYEMTSIFPGSAFLRPFSLKCCEQILGSFRVLNFSSALRQNTSHFFRSFWWKGERKNERSGLLWVPFLRKASHCTVFDHGLTTIDARDRNNISSPSSLFFFLLARYSPKPRFCASS